MCVFCIFKDSLFNLSHRDSFLFQSSFRFQFMNTVDGKLLCYNNPLEGAHCCVVTIY